MLPRNDVGIVIASRSRNDPGAAPAVTGPPKRQGRPKAALLSIRTGAGDEIRTHDPYLGKVMLYP